MSEINWQEVQEETLKYLSDLIKIDSTNPPGNEIKVAEYLRTVLEKEGIECNIYESAPNRGNLIAKIAGNGEARPLLLLGHMDVVAAHAEEWSHAPFGAEIADGYIWGRGTFDMKGMLAMELMALLLCKRSGITLKRDLVLCAAADEENGSAFGMNWLVEQGIPELQTAEFAINEGGEGMMYNGIPVYTCQSGEKGILWLKITTTGVTGHASMPISGENAILKMLNALSKLTEGAGELSLCDTTRKYLATLAKIENITAESDEELLAYARESLLGDNTVAPMFLNTMSPTILNAGERANVLPAKCEAVIDYRLLPGKTPDDLFEEIRAKLADDTIQLEVLQNAVPTESPTDTELYQIIEETVREENPQARLIPLLSPGGTDSRAFRLRDIVAYGFVPILVSDDETRRMHGIDERLSLENLANGTKILFKVIRKIVQKD